MAKKEKIHLVYMDDAEMRIECLRLAMKLKEADILETAKKFYEFVGATRASTIE